MPQNVMTSYACIIPRGSVQQKIFTGCERHINLAAIYHLNSIKKQIWMHLKRRLMETNWCKTQCKIQIREFWNWYRTALQKLIRTKLHTLVSHKFQTHTRRRVADIGVPGSRSVVQSERVPFISPSRRCAQLSLLTQSPKKGGSDA